MGRAWTAGDRCPRCTWGSPGPPPFVRKGRGLVRVLVSGTVREGVRVRKGRESPNTDATTSVDQNPTRRVVVKRAPPQAMQMALRVGVSDAAPGGSSCRKGNRNGNRTAWRPNGPRKTTVGRAGSRLDCTCADPKQKADFYTQCGTAVRTLREEIPCVFEKDVTYGIFTDDVVFVDELATPAKPNVVFGKDAYRRIYWSLRFHGKLFFSRTRVEVLRIWQPDEKVLCVRWSVKAVPRMIDGFVVDMFHVDGISEYKLNSEGYIYSHKVTIIDFFPFQFGQVLFSELAKRKKAVPTPSF